MVYFSGCIGPSLASNPPLTWQPNKPISCYHGNHVLFPCHHVPGTGVYGYKKVCVLQDVVLRHHVVLTRSNGKIRTSAEKEEVLHEKSVFPPPLTRSVLLPPNPQIYRTPNPNQSYMVDSLNPPLCSPQQVTFLSLNLEYRHVPFSYTFTYPHPSFLSLYQYHIVQII